jgi:hypothetical protein
MRTVVPIALLIALFVFGCSSVTLKPADFSWPVELVLKVDPKGTVQDTRYSFSLNVKELLFAETGDSVNVSHVTLRMIRDVRGFFYLTAQHFKSVYVFAQTDGALSLAKRIAVSEKGLTEPAFNLRPPHVQLVREHDPAVLLTPDGIAEGGKK